MRLGTCLLALPLALLAAPASQAAESFDNCKGYITSLPAVISTQGTWCMDKDLATNVGSGTALSITTNNVILDCNDYKLGGLSAGTGSIATGVGAVDRSNITVRNCNIRGFLVGLALDGIVGGGHVVEGNRFDGNTFVGLRVEGSGSMVRCNLVNDTGGSTANGVLNAYGLWITGDVDVIDNTITGVSKSTSSGIVNGIAAVDADGATIAGNRLHGLLGGAGTAIAGIQDYSATRVIYRNNHLAHLTGATATGLLCGSAGSVALGNAINSFTTGLSGCTNGGNTLTP